MVHRSTMAGARQTDLANSAIAGGTGDGGYTSYDVI